MTILYFIIAIGILILVHELGHFICAIRNNIRVEKFSIGFGPKLFSFKRGETEYRIAPIPLGGYVNMTGEDQESISGVKDEKSFAQKSIWTRIRVVAAGPIVNIIFAFLLMPVVFMIGRMEPAFLSEPPVVIGVERDSPAVAAGLQKGDLVTSIDDKEVSSWDELQKRVIISVGRNLPLKYLRDGKEITTNVTVEKLPELQAGFIGIEPIFFMGNEAVADMVQPGGPAAKAGLEKKDKIVAVNGQPVESWTSMIGLLNKTKGEPIVVTVDRAGSKLEFKVKPELSKEFGRYIIGISKSARPTDVPMVKRQYGPVDAVKNGFSECVNLISLTFVVIKKLFTAELSYKSLGGPIQIAQASAAAAKYGLAEFLYFMVFLSIQLGILNLMPIPILDGGQILFCLIEGVIRRPVPAKVRGVAQYIGLALLLTLFAFITVNDIDSVWGIKNIIGKFVK